MVELIGTPKLSGDEPSIKIGLLPERGLVMFEAGGGKKVGVPWVQALALAHNIIGKTVLYLNMLEEARRKS